MIEQQLIGYGLAIIMGMTLGLFGGGGSILTLPILVYIFQLDAQISTAYSLFIVGSTSSIGAIKHLIKKDIDLAKAFAFAIPSILAVFLTRRFLMPIIPQSIHVFGSSIEKDVAIMVLFAAIMVFASVSMIRGRKELKPTSTIKWHYIIIDGFVVGTLTGMVGAGGGFLIVPALVLLLGMSMKEAIASSLLIISLKSLIGFTGDLASNQAIDWLFLFTFTLLAILGLYVGMGIAHKIDSNKLKKAFGVFLFIMAVVIAIKELAV